MVMNLRAAADIAWRRPRSSAREIRGTRSPLVGRVVERLGYRRGRRSRSVRVGIGRNIGLHRHARVLLRALPDSTSDPYGLVQPPRGDGAFRGRLDKVGPLAHTAEDCWTDPAGDRGQGFE